jgi:beta-lactam-binding protein with PASTA domain/tRNA A-37 threonylcarbamoyl transferase component Bud32
MTHPAPPDGSGSHALVTLDGRYHVVERIAAGGMGEVFRAHDAVLAREVAIKVLHRSLAGDQALVDRFRREARAAAGLSHPNVVAVYDWGAVDGVYYMVMEYVRGRATRELLNASGRLEPAQAAEIVRQTLRALGHAHQQGFVHRDIKPENILVTTEGVVKVTDFGLARAYAEGRQTQAGTVTGTVQYLAPEQIRGEPADPRSDLYSLGIVSYELLTGKLPFTGETAMAIAYKHLSDRVPVPSAIVPSIPKELDGFVASATERDRELRPESADEMRRDLEAIEPSLPPARSLASLVEDVPEVVADDGELTAAVAVAAQTQTQTQTITRTVRTRRRRWRRWAGAVLLVAALAAAAWGIWTYLVPHHATVPPLHGVPVAAAQSQLQHLGFTVDIAKGAYSDTVPAQRVLRVDPRSGAVLKRGATVTLVPSLGPPPVPVPSLDGKSVAQATQALTTAGLKLGTPSQQYDAHVPVGEIISQQPATGTAPKGSTVNVVVSKGPAPRPVPDVTGQTKSQAMTRLTNAGFTVVTQHDFSESVVRGRVISVSPDPGVTQAFGSPVTIVVSDGPPEFPMPTFNGLSKADAQAKADGLGLTVSWFYLPGTQQATVITQTPSPGTIVHPGDPVTLYLA